jgi:RHS repeat-associated protein
MTPPISLATLTDTAALGEKSMSLTPRNLFLLSAVLLGLGGYALAASTTTTLNASSIAVSQGTSVTLTATVTSGSTAVYPGVVNFCNASAQSCFTGVPNDGLIGTAQLTSAGTAALHYIFGPGGHNVVAKFVGTSTYAASSSVAQTITVTAAAGKISTTTTITASGSVGNYTLAGTVSGPAGYGPTGSLSFLDSSYNNQNVGSAQLGAPTITPGSLSMAAGTSPGVGTNPISVAVGDFNGDGKLDLAVVNENSNTVGILLGNGDGTFKPQVTYATGTTPYSVAVGDFNGDGKLDLAVTNYGSSTVSILLGNGDGTFQPQVAFDTVVGEPDSIAVGDFNGDGKLDLVIISNNWYQVSLLLGNGDGTFQAPGRFLTEGYPSSVAIGDFNGDGKLDIAVADFGAYNVSILLGNGDGTFQPQVGYGAGFYPQSVAVGDFNGDGKLDLAVANYYGGNVSVLLGNGDGTFQTQVLYPAGSCCGTSSVAVGDFNGDGKLDLVVTNNSITNTLSILLGNGDGTFQPQVEYSIGTYGYSAAVGDFNGDGKPDLAVANYNSSSLSMGLNQTTGTSTATAILDNVSAPGSGTQYILASYGGDANFNGGQSPTTPVTGTGGGTRTSTALTVTPGTTENYGTKLQLTGTVSPDVSGSNSATGSISFYDSGSLLGSAPIGSGQASISIATLTGGSHSIIAVYSGDTNFVTSASSATGVSIADPSGSAGGGTLYSYGYPIPISYDGVGNVTGYTDSVMGMWSFSSGYDSLNRLSLGTQTPAPVNGVTQSPQYFCWNYDNFGNRQQQEISSEAFQSGSGGANACNAQSGVSLTTDLASYYGNNQISSTNARGVTASPVYDASGDVTNDGVNTYLYDGEGRICAVSSTYNGTTTMTGYLYDVDGTRVAKGTVQNLNTCDPSSVANGGNGFQTTSDYILGASGEQFTEMAVSGSTVTWVHTSVWAAGKLLATYRDTNTYFPMSDWLGTKRVVAGADGCQDAYSGLPYGDGLADVSGGCADATEHHFTGKERDAESGNDYFGARYYGSSMGRFMSPDPLLNSGHPDDPQSWNRYSYVRNNPLSRIDPTGLYDFSKCAKGDSNCAAEKQRFTDAVNKAKDLLKNMDPKSDQAKALDKALGALGTAGDKNGVTVGFGKTSTGGDLETVGLHITVDFNLHDAAQKAWRDAGNTIDGVVDDASAEVHEGIHVANDKKGITSGDEPEAYRAASYVGEAGHSTITSGVWNESWANGPDKETLRTAAIQQGAQRSENATKAYEDKQKQ